MAEFVLETPRLQARRIDSTDVETMLSVYGDPEVVRWVGNGEPFDRALCERWVEITHKDYATRGYGMLALVERESGNVVGFGGLVHLESQTEAEIKYALHRSRWGHGLATEAAAALLALGAARFGLPIVIAATALENEASQRVLLKVGMRRGALRRNEDGTLTQLFAWRPGATVRNAR
jgi:[ribosomal protein S5]-alanine N-acetyltransferase